MMNLSEAEGEIKVTRGETMLRQVAAHNPHLTFEELMGVSDEMPSEVCRLIADSGDRAAALDCWRDMMVAAIDEVHRLWVHRLYGDVVDKTAS